MPDILVANDGIWSWVLADDGLSDEETDMVVVERQNRQFDQLWRRRLLKVAMGHRPPATSHQPRATGHHETEATTTTRPQQPPGHSSHQATTSVSCFQERLQEAMIRRHTIPALTALTAHRHTVSVV